MTHPDWALKYKEKIQNLDALGESIIFMPIQQSIVPSAIPSISGDTEAASFFKIEGFELLSDTLNNANAPDNLSAGIAVVPLKKSKKSDRKMSW